MKFTTRISLSDLYRKVIGIDIENAHNSKYDVINLHKVVKTLFQRNQFKVDSLYCKLTQMSKDSLLVYCKTNKITNYSGKSKDEIIKLIEKHQAGQKMIYSFIKQN
jgi:hypothetical protein